jgi:hypothetical protein
MKTHVEQSYCNLIGRCVLFLIFCTLKALSNACQFVHNQASATGTTTVNFVSQNSHEPFSALITLHDHEGKRTDQEHFDMTMAFLRPVVEDMTWASGVWFGDRLVSIADASPFLLFWAYQAITIYRRLEGHYGEKVQQHMLLMKEKLRVMSLRWKAGGMYIFFDCQLSMLMLARGIFANPKCTRNHNDVNFWSNMRP